MKSAIGGLALALSARGALSACTVKPGQEDFAAYCELANCEIYTAFCESSSGGPPTGKCKPKKGMEAYWEFCTKDDCDTSYEAFCELNDGSGGDPKPSDTPQPSIDCDSIANRNPLGVNMEENCAVQIAKHVCKRQSDCSDEACVVERLNKFYAALGLDATKPNPDPVTSTAKPPTNTPQTNDATRPPYQPPSGDDVPFAKNISPYDIVMTSPWGITNYNGKAGYEAAKEVHQQITEAIRNGPPEFKAFCGTGNLEADRREAAAFFANVAKETGGMSAFEESTGATYCTHLGDGDEGLQAAGKEFPCCVGDDKKSVCADQKNCPYGCDMHGRGAIQLTWNFNYGRFSEFYFGDQEVLLKDPSKVEPTGALGWAASIWFWMTPQDYGGACPPPSDFSASLPTGTQSCHQAMHDEQGGGFGQTIRIINGGYEACPKTGVPNSALYRIEYFFNMAKHMGVPAKAGCTLGDPKCDVSGMEHWDATDGKVGNIQIGHEKTSDCPNCTIHNCTSSVTPKKYGLCMKDTDDCPDPLLDVEMYKCT